MNTQNKKPYFRKFNDDDWDLYMGCEERPIIAQYKDFFFEGDMFNIDIVIDTWTSLDDKKVERVGFHCCTNDYGKAFVFMNEAATRTEARKLAEHMLFVGLSFESFEVNKFSMLEN